MLPREYPSLAEERQNHSDICMAQRVCFDEKSFYNIHEILYILHIIYNIIYIINMTYIFIIYNILYNLYIIYI